MKNIRILVFCCAAGMLLFGKLQQASVQIAGNGAGWTENTNTPGLPVVSGDSVTFTNNGYYEYSSIFNDTKQSDTSFDANFTYQPSGADQADGVAFVIQNSSEGLDALQSQVDDGSGLGCTGSHRRRRFDPNHLELHSHPAQHPRAVVDHSAADCLCGNRIDCVGRKETASI